MNDLIEFDETQGLFHLHNQQISYLMAIEDFGLLSHLYFGPAVAQYHGQRRYPRRDRGFSGNLPGAEDRRFSPDTLPQEFSSSGAGDYRIPAAEIYQANGSKATDFVYQGYQILAGKPQLAGLPATFVQDQAEAATLVITLVDSASQVALDLSYTIYRQRPIITRAVLVRNQGQTPVRLNKIASVQLDFPATDLEVISLPGAHVRERQVQREKIGYGVKSFASRRGATSHQMSNFISLVTPATTENQGAAYGIELVYSGNHALELEQDQLGQLRLVAGINQADFSWQLAPLEQFQTPEVILAYSDQGLNGLSQAYHHLLKERLVRSPWQNRPRPILVNNWEATYFDFDEAKLRPIVDQAAELGLEMFVLDDGWFGHRDNDRSSLGDWVVDQRKFPQGLTHFTNYVHQKGLKFGLWFEPEMISRDSALYHAHPDYLLAAPDRQPAPSRDQFVLDLGRAEVRENIYQQMAAILATGQIDYVKWDMNRHFADLFSDALPADRQGEVSHRYMLGLYALLERLTQNFPQILWEGCSGGGGRFDAGMAYYMPQIWTSDNTDSVARLAIQWGTSLVYPPSLMTAHVSAVPNHQTGRTTSMALRGDVAMSGMFGYELDLTKLTPAEKQAVKVQIATDQQYRALVQQGDFYRLSAPETPAGCAWSFVAADRSEMLAFAFSELSQAQPAFQLIKFVGLDPQRQYQDQATRQVYGGDELMNLGLYRPVASGDFQSWRYHFRAL
ncbi:alpha-galactosidase [Lapidilactobacillus luobeiensis]|uniref:alpha-galactosidase n=1 Tax=Lapidilactobacillus luobeiensis TaxID=2950371 RepID=UPI0021C35DF8|nr:alpha-galactosidase [Lapidilactobacillus luobeiensis]